VVWHQAYYSGTPSSLELSGDNHDGEITGAAVGKKSITTASPIAN
jgi:hypothetical protein